MKRSNSMVEMSLVSDTQDPSLFMIHINCSIVLVSRLSLKNEVYNL